jgi:DNA-binding NtrC family response regulator
VRELEDTIRKAAATAFPVLILGETGTGVGE